MSDGYLTTAGWFIDLIARWIELAARHGVAIDGDFMKRMTGLVLLDEIDLHLHRKVTSRRRPRPAACRASAPAASATPP